MTIERDLAAIATQESRLQFPSFSLATGLAIGRRLVDLAEDRSLGVAIDVSLHAMPVFYAATPGSTPDNPGWIRRKRATTLRFFRSSYAVGLSLAQKGETLTGKFALADADFASHGGSFPILVAGTGCIGAITVSGLPQRDDHNMVVEALCAELGVVHNEMRLEV